SQPSVGIKVTKPLSACSAPLDVITSYRAPNAATGSSRRSSRASARQPHCWKGATSLRLPRLADQFLPRPRDGRVLAIEQELPINDGHLAIRLVIGQNEAATVLVNL